MIEKRYNFNVNKMIIEKDGKYFAYTTVEHSKIVNELNSLHEENQKLKKMNELLIAEVMWNKQQKLKSKDKTPRITPKEWDLKIKNER